MAPKRKRCNYTEDNLLSAVAAVKSGSMGYRKASTKYGIPIMTLSDKVKGKTPLKLYKPGPTMYLAEQQEDKLAKYLLHMAQIGYGIPRKDIPNIVKKILDDADKDGYVLPSGEKFKDNKPSICWVYRFLGRHPEISARTPENFGFQRAYVNAEQIRNWFTGLEEYLLENFNLVASEFLSEENCERIFNLDESGFPLQGTAGKLKIIAGRGTKCIYKLTSDTKQQITVLACVSAGGTYCNPLVIYPGLQTPSYNFTDVNEEDYNVGFTPNG